MPKLVKHHGLMKNMLDWEGIPRYTLVLDTLTEAILDSKEV
jgi:hypothetical protein